MPFGSAKDTKTIAKVALFLTGLVLLFGTVPILNLAVSSPLFMGVTFGTLLGVLVLYAAYLMHTNRI